jgi:hypothetical protein
MDMAATWERRLAREGLAPLDSPRGDLVSKRGAHVRGNVDSSSAAVAQHREWALSVLGAHAFSGAGRRAWTMYADGKSFSEIEAATGMGRRDISRLVAEVRLQHGGPENPWKKSGRRDSYDTHADPLVTARLLELALACADYNALTVAVEGDGKLRELTGGMDMSEQLRKAAPLVMYKQIELRRGQTVQLLGHTGPGGQAPKDKLPNVEGRPHVGGIDVTYPTKDGDAIITVPWGIINQAVRLVVESGA